MVNIIIEIDTEFSCVRALGIEALLELLEESDCRKPDKDMLFLHGLVTPE